MRFKGLKKFAKWWRHTLELSLWLNILHTLFPGLQNKMNTHASTRFSSRVTKILTRKPKIGNLTNMTWALSISRTLLALSITGVKKVTSTGILCWRDVTWIPRTVRFSRTKTRRCMCLSFVSVYPFLFNRTFISCSKKILCPNTSGIFVSTYNSARYLHLKSLHLKSIDNRVVNTFNRSKVLIKDKYGTTLRF